jgi:hypothetical protein
LIEGTVTINGGFIVPRNGREKEDRRGQNGRGLIEGIVTAQVLSSRNWKEKEDRKGES